MFLTLPHSSLPIKHTKMDRYKIESKVGGGAFGSVFRAIHRATGLKVAIKQLIQRFGAASWEECLQLQEVEALRRLRHSSIVQLYEVIREEDTLYLVFEFVGPNLYQVMENRAKPLPEAKIRKWLRQVLQGLAYMHAKGYYHRDIKPENLLVKGSSSVKIADLGLVRSVLNSRPCTEYVSTRWYRAPEVLLRADYGPAVDVFAVGAVAAELFNLRPLFPGSSEPDQLACLCAVLGSPTAHSWPAGLDLANSMGFVFPDTPPGRWEDILPSATCEARDLIAAMVSWDPATRPTPQQALRHPFFHQGSPYLPVSGAEQLRLRLMDAAKRLEVSARTWAEAQGQTPASPSELECAQCVDHHCVPSTTPQHEVVDRSRAFARASAAVSKSMQRRRDRSPQFQRLVAATAGRQEAALHRQRFQGLGKKASPT